MDAVLPSALDLLGVESRWEMYMEGACPEELIWENRQKGGMWWSSTYKAPKA